MAQRAKHLAKRRNQTIADLAAIALCPSLIVLLISSLVHFLVMCVYRGGYSGRIGYIWFMFILGAVAIARLSIQESRKYAFGYAAVLGGATFVVLSRFMTVQGPLAALSPIINAGTIALVWFLADRITFDCTLINEDEDASGRGLLDGLTDDGATDQDANQLATRKRGHQPGRTVLWLTAAALPIFGFGQLMLPQDERWQQSAMLALAVYLFAAISLLVATSFLGVRRYLRQRGVDMPANVSTAWLAGGVAMTAFMLLACFLLPQPGKMLANVELPQNLQSPDWLKPSKYGWGSETSKPDEQNPNTATAPPQTPSEKQGQPSNGDSSQSSGEPGGNKNGKNKSSQDPSNPGGKPSDNGKSASAGEEQKGKPGEGQSTKDPGEKSSEPSAKPDGKTADNNQSGQKSEGQKSEPKEKGDTQKSSKPANDDSQSEPSDSQDKSTEPQSQPTAAKQDDAKQDDAKQADNPQPPAESPSPLSNLLPSFSGVLRALIYIVLIGIIAAFAWIHRAEIAKAWEAFLVWLRGEETASADAGELLTPNQPTDPSMSFAAFRNPLGGRGDPRESVIVTYQAAEAWWREHGQPRKPDETPFEYSRRLRPGNKSDHEALLRLTEAYNRVVYGNETVQPPDLVAAAAVWKSFTIR